MARNSLALYSLTLENEETRSLDLLDDLKGGIDLYRLVEDFCRQKKTLGRQTNPALRRSLKLTDFTSDPASRTIHGYFEKGNYGTRGAIYNVTTDDHTYTKGPDETLPQPFYFSATLPEGETKAFLAFQRVGNSSVQTAFVGELERHLRFLQETYKMALGNVITQSFIRELLRAGAIGEIRMIGRQIPNDVARLYADGYRDVSGSVELTVKATKGQSLPLNEQIMRAFTNRGMNVSDIIVFEDMKFQYENLKVQVTASGRDWTIDLSDFNKMRPYYVMDENIQQDEDGHPALEAVHAFATRLINEYRQEAASEIEVG